MQKKSWSLIVWVFFAVAPCYGYPLLETENFIFTLSSYLRTDLINFNNVVDLDSSNSQDSTTYLGVDYSLGLKYEARNNGPEFYLKFERNGPYDYDAPIFIHKKLTVSGPSEIKAYRNKELLPQAEEFWLDLPIANLPLRFKAGLFPYEIGKGFAQGTGSFENYGFSLSQPGEHFSWRFHYFRPDLVYKTRLGPRIKQEKQEGIAYEPNAANYFAFDTTILNGCNKFQPFIGLLLDRTSEGKRTNKFATPVHKEALGTLGLDYDLNIKDFSIG
jgi:hypothetical protein